MAASEIYICTACGTESTKWAGRCDACGEWNTIEVKVNSVTGPTSKSLGRKRGTKIALTNLKFSESGLQREQSGFEEFDRVIGGGLVPASATLVGGDPGIGKSTLMLQVAAKFSTTGLSVMYVSGEEAAGQIQMRANRLGIAAAPVKLATETSLRDIRTTLEAERPALAIIDSVQTIWADFVDSSPGSITQVRAAAHELTVFAKRCGTAVILVGHVTKEGQIAGPRVIEHMVDTVLYFEGERGHHFRILRAVKNRFGPADEIGVFEMTGRGLTEAANPSALFLSEGREVSPGSAVLAGIEGTRPVLVEIQALVAPSPHAQPRRAVVGWDSGRLAMVLAVLEARCGVPFVGLDVYLNVAGGLKIHEPAADLAVAAALLSSREDVSLPEKTVVFGEISLSGALRPASKAQSRLKEAQKLGFSGAIAPVGKKSETVVGIDLVDVSDLSDFVGIVFGTSGLKKRKEAHE